MELSHLEKGKTYHVVIGDENDVASELRLKLVEDWFKEKNPDINFIVTGHSVRIGQTDMTKNSKIKKILKDLICFVNLTYAGSPGAMQITQKIKEARKELGLK